MKKRRPKRHTQLNVLVDRGDQPPEHQLHVYRCAAEDYRYTHDTVFKTGLAESRITARITPSAIASTIEEAVSYKVFTRPTFKTRAMAASPGRR
jgi:hypothetical protein